MRITESQLRRIVRQELAVSMIEHAVLTEAVTVGDVKQAIEIAKKAKNAETAKQGAVAVGKPAVKALVGLFTAGLGPIIIDAVEAGMEAGEVAWDLYGASQSIKPAQKNSHPLWQKLTVDPETSKILDDSVEDEFANHLEQQIRGLADTDELPDTDELLRDWMKGKYSGAHVAKAVGGGGGGGGAT
jgi:hypothetical protein